jgi:hypothetical protein
LVGPAAAAELSVTTGTAAGSVIIEAKRATLDEVLTRLGETEGFTIKRVRSEKKAETISGHFEGPLTAVLSRVLDRENYAIEHSCSAKTGIVRVLLYGSIHAAPPSASKTQPQAPVVAPRVAPAAPVAAAVQPAAVRMPQPLPQPQLRQSGQKPQPQARIRYRGGSIN